MQKKISILFLICFSICGLGACNDDGPALTLVGADKDGKEIEMKVPQDKFQERFSDILNSASITSINTLQNEIENQAKWGLTEAEVGIDLQLSGSITAIVGLGLGSGASVTLSRETAVAQGAGHE